MGKICKKQCKHPARMAHRHLEKVMKNIKEEIPELLSMNDSRSNGKLRELFTDTLCKIGNPTDNYALWDAIEKILFTKAIKNIHQQT